MVGIVYLIRCTPINLINHLLTQFQIDSESMSAFDEFTFTVRRMLKMGMCKRNDLF